MCGTENRKLFANATTPFVTFIIGLGQCISGGGFWCVSTASPINTVLLVRGCIYPRNIIYEKRKIPVKKGQLQQTVSWHWNTKKKNLSVLGSTVSNASLQ